MPKVPVKVRFAPSPTGELHLGGARTALFNWLYAKNKNGQFYLRIEDTDSSRSKDEYTDQIFEALSWLGLEWEDEIVHQSERFSLYKTHIQELLSKDMIYPCFCSKDKLSELKDSGAYKYDGFCRNLTEPDIMKKINLGLSFTYRLRISKGQTRFKDIIYGEIVTDHKELDDFIVVRSDGSPTYNFTAAIDDNDMAITHIIRGEDHLSNTPKQILLYRAFGYKIPKFAHLPMILGSDKKRLSKRHGAPGVQKFKDEGYFPESLINYLALLGWNPKTADEVYSLKALIKVFNLSNVQKKGAIWDDKKLHWISGQHIFLKKSESLLDDIKELSLSWGVGYEKIHLINIIDSLKVRSKSIMELIDQSDPFFNDPKIFSVIDKNKAWPNASVNTIVESFYKILLNHNLWEADEIEKLLKSFARKNSIGLGKLIMPLRLAVFGSLSGPALYDIFYILGHGSTLRRIKNALEKFSE